MTRKPVTTAFWMGRLPHWEVEGGRYFITMHLAGAIPLSGRLRLKQLSQELRSIDQKDERRWFSLQRAIFGEMEAARVV